MVKPIAIQDNLAKTLAAEKITQIEKSQAELAQRETRESVRRKNIEQQRKPQEMEKSDEVIIHREKDQKRNGQEHKKDKESETPAEDETAENKGKKDEEIKHLDIRA